MSDAWRIGNQNALRHGMARHGHVAPTYQSWCNMRRRCNDRDHPQYKDYGARGIYVDPEWESFDAFLRDMGERPSGLTIHRIDNDGPYCKANCKWATSAEQVSNKRKHPATLWVDLSGITVTSKFAAGIVGVKHDTLRSRIRKGWKGDMLFRQPVDCRFVCR